MESQPQNPEFRNYPENFHSCVTTNLIAHKFQIFFLYILISFLNHKQTFLSKLLFF